MSHILRAAVLAAILLPFPALADQAGKSPAGVRYHGGDEIILQHRRDLQHPPRGRHPERQLPGEL